MHSKLKYIIFIGLISISTTIKSLSFNIQADTSILNNTITKITINDIQQLVNQTKENTLSINSKVTTDYQIQLSQSNDFIANININNNDFKNKFEWTKNNTTLLLTANSYKAFSDGLYALLQEQLGFKFYHTKEQIIPNKIEESLINFKSFKGEQVFSKNGFHLHTMHPIELTEFLLDETKPNALNEVKQYIDWLARNGQNYFEFNLLESINKDSWLAHAQAITNYAHQRGIFCGVDLSIHMIQQKAFQLYSGWFKHDKKIIDNVNWLAQAGFDIWNLELSSTEFSQQDYSKLLAQVELIQNLLNKNNIVLMSRSHVVKANKMVSNNKNDLYSLLNNKHGLMIHTVMFYSLIDEVAPVYENENLQHMQQLLLQEQQKRTVWYYPESAYWITFDNSVPMFLMSYLKARLDDINFCETHHITGHLTFTSGWEWNYWLIDWSIARWSWNYEIDNITIDKYPLQYISDVVKNDTIFNYIKQSYLLQERYIKDSTLIKVLTAQTITDEIGGKINLELHPRPELAYKYIRNKATQEELNFISNKYINNINSYINKQEKLNKPTSNNVLEQELIDGINITLLRAKHKYYTLKYLINYRANKIDKQKNNIDYLLDSATTIRQQAQQIVQQREQHYRYNLHDLSYQHKSHTAYEFGYLYPTHQLHFWQREELQAKHNKYKFWYRNIWNVFKIIGIVN
ncbi:MAG: hypothetical protein H6553_09830 [Chitinophagales bacterium]|nr:hypothetical protein [Chitinophagales bacterium]